MADNYKILAQAIAASIDEITGLNKVNTIYTVPQNTQVAISSICLINSSSISQDYYLGIVRSQDASSSIGLSLGQIIIPTRSIEPNTVDEISGGITLSAGDQIRVYSESPDLIVQVYGVEIE